MAEPDNSGQASNAADVQIQTHQSIEILHDIDSDLRQSLSREEQDRVLPVVHAVVERRAAYFSGPHPPPELIAEYERIAPGWGLRILEMGEREQQHRHACDLQILAQNGRELDESRDWLIYLRRGQVFGFLALLIVAGLGIFAMLEGFPAVAIACFGSLAVAVVVAFIRGAAPPSSRGGPADGTSPK